MGLDEKIAAVLRKAAEEADFLELLLADREKALAGFDLAPHEKAILMAADAKQLRKMVEEARKRPGYHVGPVTKVVGGVANTATWST